MNTRAQRVVSFVVLLVFGALRLGCYAQVPSEAPLNSSHGCHVALPIDSDDSRASGTAAECEDGSSSAAGGVIVRSRCDDGEPAVAKGSEKSSSRRLDGLLARVPQCLIQFERKLQIQDAPNWVRFHELLIFGPRGFDERRITPVRQALFDSLLNNPHQPTPFVIRRELPWPREVGSRLDKQHHRDQFLHKFSMVGVPLEASLIAGDRAFTVEDLFNASLRDSRKTGDLSWTISAYSHYLKPGKTWTNKFGESLSLGALLRASLEQASEFCGGAHQMLAWARVGSDVRWQDEASVRPLLAEIQERIVEKRAQLRAEQSSDGSFRLRQPIAQSKSQADDVAASRAVALSFTGHSLEWMAFGLPRGDLTEHWILNAVSFVLDMLEAEYPDGSALLSQSPLHAEESVGAALHGCSGALRWRASVLSD